MLTISSGQMYFVILRTGEDPISSDFAKPRSSGPLCDVGYYKIQIPYMYVYMMYAFLIYFAAKSA